MYNSKSKIAEEFIDDQEILDTLAWAEQNRENTALIQSILTRAEDFQGISYREAALLLECEDPACLEQMFSLARKIKQHIYGNRIVMFAPLYLSNYCVNSCRYCPYHHSDEVIALQDMGHKRLALETGEDPVNCPIEYVLESIQTIYGISHKNGAIRRVNVNIAATTVENYRRLKEAGIGTYILFQLLIPYRGDGPRDGGRHRRRRHRRAVRPFTLSL